LRLGKWLIVLPSIDKIHTPVPAVPYLSSPARAGCIPRLLFGNALALVYWVNLSNHRRLHAYTSRQLFVTNLPTIWKYLFATCDRPEAKLLKFSPLHKYGILLTGLLQFLYLLCAIRKFLTGNGIALGGYYYPLYYAT
jgi:hypothetical protein